MKKDHIKAILILLFCVVVLVVFPIMKKQGITLDTMSQSTGKETIESIIHTAYEERDGYITLNMKDANATYGGLDNSMQYLYDQMIFTPEHYLIDFRNCRFRHESGNENLVTLTIPYFTELDNPETLQAIETVADTILSKVPEDASEWEIVKIIHDELIRRVTYEESTYDYTIYGALVEGRAVCTGIAITYEYLLERAGISCDTMAGYVVDETRTDFSDLSSDRLHYLYGEHAWNIVTLTDPDGSKKSYIVDVTWDNSDRYTDDGDEHVMYSWFLLSLADFRQTGRLPYPIYDYDAWDFSSKEMNYYVQLDAVVTEYDIETIAAALKRQLDAGNNVLTVCWDDTARYLNAKEQIENGDISKIVKHIGNGTYTYSMTNDRYTTGKYCLNVYVKN